MKEEEGGSGRGEGGEEMKGEDESLIVRWKCAVAAAVGGRGGRVRTFLNLMRDGYATREKQLFQSGSPGTEIFKNQQQGDSLQLKDNNNNNRKEGRERGEEGGK